MVTKRPRRNLESGSVIVLMALSLVALFAFAALSIDLSHVYQQERDLQSATDVAALAAVIPLTNAPTATATGAASPNDVIYRGLTVAQANGVSLSEIEAGAVSNTGTIQVGHWDTNSASFDPTAAQANWNAVRVTARRSVSLAFGPMIGMSHMSPGAHSIAMSGGLGSASGGNGGGLIPFGVDELQATNAFYSPYTVCKKTDVGGTGDFGELNFGGGGFYNNMVTGCNCTFSLGDQVGTITGKNGGCQNCTSTGFTDRLNADSAAIMPVVDSWPSGSSGTATIIGFIGVKILSVTSGGNWCVTLENVPVDDGGGGGGTTNVPLAFARFLVQ